LITHKLSILDSVDKIILLKDGMVVEEGSYSQLLEKRGEYFNLYNAKGDQGRDR
jgi:ATP-binding cassette subfamily B protein